MINLETQLTQNTVQPKPEPYHCRTGHMLSSENSKIYQQLLKTKGYADTADLVDIFEKHVRSVLEFGIIVWHPSITQSETIDIERVQKSFCRIVLGDQYVSCANALETLILESK